MITKAARDLIDLDFENSLRAAGNAQNEGRDPNSIFASTKFMKDYFHNIPKHLWKPVAGGVLGYSGASMLGAGPESTIMATGLGTLIGNASAITSASDEAFATRGLHPAENPVKAVFGYKRIEPEYVKKYLPDYHKKTAGIFNPYDLDVRNADYLAPNEVAAIMRRRMVNKSQDKPTSWTNALLGGTIPGAVIGGLATRNFKGALLGTGIGALAGSGAKLNDDNDRRTALRDLRRFDASLGTQKAFTAQAMANARLNRDIEAQRRALAMNDADREFHQNTFGNQQYRRVL